MEIISRAAAKAAGLNRYYTGQPCKNGHNTYRYTTSGACYGCLKSYNSPAKLADTAEIMAARAELAAAKSEAVRMVHAAQAKLDAAIKAAKASEVQDTAARQAAAASATSDVSARREARAALAQVKLRVFDADLDAVKAAAYAFGAMRYPGLQPGDTYPGLLPTDLAGGTALYKFNCHAGDIEPLRAIAVALTNARSLNGAEVREAALRATLAGVEVDPAPEWKP